MKKNILKSNSSFVIIGKSPAWSETINESGRIFSLVQSVDFGFSSNKQASKQLGYQNYSSNIDLLTPQVDLSIDYYFSPYLNNELLMGFQRSGVNKSSMFDFKNKNYNFYFLSNERDFADGFDEVGKIPNTQQWQESEAICFGNCYLSNYSLSMSLGQLPRVSTKFKSSNIGAEILAAYRDDVAFPFIQNPALDPYSGRVDYNSYYYYPGLITTSGNVFSDVEDRSDLNPPVALSHESSVSIISKSVADSGITPLRNFSNLILQSCNLSFDFNRVDLYKFGNNSVSDRKLQFPIVANIQIESLVSGFNGTSQNTQFLKGSATTNNKENLYDVNFIFSNEINSVTGFYNFQGAKLTSLNYSTQINDIYKMSASFSVEITEKNGFIMNNVQKYTYRTYDVNANRWNSEPNNWDFS
jgi:L-rhamnose mutarotase